MIAVPYTLELLDPLLATSFGAGDPNSKRSLDYIPGSMVRGALIGTHLRWLNKSQLAADDDNDYRRFLSDSTLYLHAYPQVTINGYLRRLLPTPKSWQQVKVVAGLDLEAINPDDVYDPVTLGWKDLSLSDELSWKHVGGEDAFCWHERGSVYLHQIERSILDHTTRSRRAGRATGDDGNLFRYDALAPGQHFAGVILTGNQDDADHLRNLLAEDRLSLGGARRAGYGRVRVTFPSDESWPGETPPISEGLKPGDHLLLTCLSACILLDAEGNPTADLNADRLAHHLGLQNGQLVEDLTATQRSLTLIGGFNRTAGLPQPQRQAIVPGSTFGFTLLAPLSAKQLQTLQTKGIGLQRLDGYGRVGVNWQQAALYSRLTKENKTLDAAPALPEKFHLLAQQIGERILREEMDQKLLSAIQNVKLRDRSQVSNSQLARVRTATREALRLLPPTTLQQATTTDLVQLRKDVSEPLTEFLQQLKRPAQEQLQRTQLTLSGNVNIRLSHWLNERIAALQMDEPLDFPSLTPVILGALHIKPPPAWRIEYILRLMDGVLAQAAKQSQKG